MPLTPDPSSLDGDALQTLDETLHAKLVATRTLVGHLAPALHDPEALRAASDLLRSILALLDRPGPRTREELVREVDLSNAVLLAVIDLIKSHADVPRVPRHRRKG
jgi:hypothetical protein